MSWTPSAISDQSGRTAVVTGANSGIGFHTARLLASKGAHVIMACRNPTKAATAREEILTEHPHANCTVGIMDLADLDSVRRFAEDLMKDHQQIDLLINNAGVMIPPYTQTAQGFELQFGTNHLAHFALTGLLLPLLTATKNSRVVTVASLAHRFARIDFDDLQHEKRYIAWEAYGQSKVANLLFCYELQRRLEASGHPTLSTAAHPGVASTGIGRESTTMNLAIPWFSQSAEVGAWPTLQAATDENVSGGSYWGPSWLFQLMGAPKQVNSSRHSRDLATASKLWNCSQELTGVQFLNEGPS